MPAKGTLIVKSVHVWAKFRISYFTPLAGQLAACRNHFRSGFAVAAHRLVQRDDPFQGPAPSSTSNSPSGSDSTSAVAHLTEGPTARMDHLRVIHLTSQPNPRISPLYGTLSPCGPKSSYELGHIQRHGSYLTGRVDSWVGASY